MRRRRHMHPTPERLPPSCQCRTAGRWQRNAPAVLLSCCRPPESERVLELASPCLVDRPNAPAALRRDVRAPPPTSQRRRRGPTWRHNYSRDHGSAPAPTKITMLKAPRSSHPRNLNSDDQPASPNSRSRPLRSFHSRAMSCKPLPPRRPLLVLSI